MTEDPVIRQSLVPVCDCNLARSFDLIGDRWTLLILRSALYGVRRFDDFQAELEIPRSVLSKRLGDLVDIGIMQTREYREEGQRARVEYVMTEMGRSLGLPFIAMTEWGDRWLGNNDPPLILRSKATGHRLRVALVDEKGKITKPPDVETVVSSKVHRVPPKKR